MTTTTDTDAAALREEELAEALREAIHALRTALVLLDDPHP